MRQRLNLTLYLFLALVVGTFVATLIAGNKPLLGLDLQGGVSITQQPVKPYTSDGLNLVVDRIRERVDSLGVAEPEILRQGDAIVVNLPGVKNLKDAERLVEVTGQVYLRPVIQCLAATPTTTTTTTVPGATTSSTPGGATTSTPSGATTTTAAGGPSRPLAPPSSGDSTTTTAAPTGTAGGTTTTTNPGTTTTTVAVDDPTQQAVLPTLDGGKCLVGPSGGTGEVFSSNAEATIINNQGWGVTVGLKSGASGEGVWNQIAAACFSKASTCPSKQLAIELDGVIISAPTVEQPSFSGSVQITGAFKEAEAKNLARVLKSGSLPVRLVLQAEQNVSPTLGKDSLHAALVSGLVGVALVLLFMLLYYRTLGIIVIFGVLISALALWTVISFLSATQGLTLSLSGIAGVIVSVGVTVDSYVVFFERLKDEVRSGRTMRNSAQRGFAAAWRTIIVADLVSLIGAGVLYYLTVGSVRNFAFFLGLSTFIDLAVAYLFTRPAVLLIARTEWMSRRKVMGIEVAESAAIVGAEAR